MKKFTFKLTAAILLTGLLAACKPSPVMLSGEIKNYQGGAIECMINQGRAVVPDSMVINEDGSFFYTRDFPEGAEIWIASEDAKGFVRLYLKNGDKLHVALSASADSLRGRCEVEFSGDDKASRYLSLYDDTYGNPLFRSFNKATEYASFKEYRSEIDKAGEQLEAALKKTGDPVFISKEQVKIDKERKSLPFNYVWGKRDTGMAVDADKDFNEYAESFDRNDMELAKDNMVYMYITWYQACHPDSLQGKGVQFLSILKDRVTNQEVIDKVASDYMGVYMDGGADIYLAATLDTFKEITTRKEDVEKYMAMGKEMVKILPGAKAPDFALNDVNGKALRFSDIIGKGKVVYLDVWATWCGPCCAEIPFMEKLAEHYAGNPKIEIISISIDENMKAWKKKLETDKPQWRQFVVPDGFKSALCKDYRIDGIPRFMLIGKDGKILNVNAPRPSDDKIIRMLDENLK